MGLNCVKIKFKNDSEVTNFRVLLKRVCIYGTVISVRILKVQIYFLKYFYKVKAHLSAEHLEHASGTEQLCQENQPLLVRRKLEAAHRKL